MRGLELGNAVFTAFEGDLARYVEMKEKVVDMGAGLERLSWITQGTPTSYDVTFESVLKKMQEVSKVEYDVDLFMRYSRLAGTMNLDEFPSALGGEERHGEGAGRGAVADTGTTGSDRGAVRDR